MSIADITRLVEQAKVYRLPQPQGLYLTWVSEYGTLRAPRCNVAGLIEQGSLVVCYGDANTGKSTFVLDLVLSVARGDSWRGRHTRQGLVVYLALEGPSGLRRRVHAYQRHHGLQGELPFCDIAETVQLTEPSDVVRLLAAIREAEKYSQLPAGIIVIDTVARALAGADENDGRDMGALVAACDRIRNETGATVLLIHHSGKDSTRGARGHSSLRAAVDTEIEVSGQVNPRQAKVTKQRDLPSGDTFAFDLVPVEIGIDEETRETISACVVRHHDEVSVRRALPNGRNQQLLLGAIREHTRATGSTVITTPDLREIAKAQGLRDRRRFSESRESLERDGWIIPCVGGYRFAGEEL